MIHEILLRDYICIFIMVPLKGWMTSKVLMISNKVIGFVFDYLTSVGGFLIHISAIKCLLFILRRNLK